MADDRTSEQQAADTNLAEAIERSVRAYGSIPRHGMITDWAVLGGGISASDDGGDVDLTFILLPDAGRTMPWRHLLGLLRVHTIGIEDDYRATREEDPT